MVPEAGNAGLATSVDIVPPHFVRVGCASQLAIDDKNGQGTFESPPKL